MSTATRPTSLPDGQLGVVLSRLENVKREKGGYVACCPVHGDRHPSLAVSLGRSGQVLVTCRSRHCSFEEIVRAMGLQSSDMFPATEKVLSFPAGGTGTRATLVAQYDYRDANGQLLFQSCRFEPGHDGKAKTFRLRRPVAGGWVWNMEGVERVIYRLPDVIEGIALGKRSYIVEGEKDADALIARGLIATTNPEGSGHWTQAMSETFRDAPDVVVIADNDDAGRNHQALVANGLLAVGATVRGLSLPGVPEKGDVSDYLAAGGTLESLEQLATDAPVWAIAIAPCSPKTYRKNTFAGWKSDPALLVKPQFTVPYVALAARSTYCAAREKSGKSTLWRHAIAAATRGRDFLGRPCTPLKALWIGVEEHIGDQVQGFEALDPHPENLIIVPELNGIKDLTELLHDEQFGIAVIDTWISFVGTTITDASASAQSGPIMQAITNLSHATSTSIVILGHGRKSDGQPRDSSALTAGVDLICTMLPPSDADARRDPTLRMLEIKGRGIPQSFVPIHLTAPGALTYELARSIELDTDVLALQWVQEHPGCSSRDVAGGIGKRDADVFRELIKLEEGGVIENRGSDTRKKWHSAVRPIPPDMGGE